MPDETSNASDKQTDRRNFMPPAYWLSIVWQALLTTATVSLEPHAKRRGDKYRATIAEQFIPEPLDLLFPRHAVHSFFDLV